MTRFSRILLLGSFMVLACGVLFANGVQDSASGGDNELSMIHFMSPAQVDPNDKAFAAMMESFRANHPDITINDEFIQHDNYEMKLKAMVATNELPDIYYTKPDLFPVLRENGLLMSIDGILSDDPGFSGKLREGVLGDFTHDGKVWAFPFQLVTTHVLYYNKAILKEAGYDSFPSDMDEFIQACKDIRKAGHIPVAMGNKGKWLTPSCVFNSLVYRYTDAQWFDSIFNKKGAKFTDKPFIEATEKLQELVAAGAFNKDMNSIDNNQMRTLFYSGDAAMFIEGSWAIGPIMDNVTGPMRDDIGLAVLPPVKGKESLGKLVSGGAGWGICINDKISDEKKALAAEFIKEMFGQGYTNIAAKNGGFPTMDPEVDESELDPIQVAYDHLGLEFGPVFDVLWPSAIIDVYYNDMQKVLMGTMTPMEYAENLEAAR